VSVTASIGVAGFPGQASTLDRLERLADAALYLVPLQATFARHGGGTALTLICIGRCPLTPSRHRRWLTPIRAACTAPGRCPSNRVRPRGTWAHGRVRPRLGPHPCYGPDSAAHINGTSSPEKKLPLWEINLASPRMGIPSGVWSMTTASNTCLPVNITPG